MTQSGSSAEYFFVMEAHGNNAIAIDMDEDELNETVRPVRPMRLVDGTHDGKNYDVVPLSANFT